MTVPTRTPLGASTLNRKWYVDVDSALPAGPAAFIGVFGITDFKPLNDPTKQDDSDFDSEGYKSEVVTALAWGAEVKVARKTTASDATAYDPGQEILRIASNKQGVENRVHIRYYEMTPGGPRVEAWEGYVSVEWAEDGGNMEATDTVTVKLSGQGKRVAIAHPDDEEE